MPKARQRPNKSALQTTIGTAKVAPGFRWEWRAFGSPAIRPMLPNLHPAPIRLTTPYSIPDRRGADRHPILKPAATSRKKKRVNKGIKKGCIQKNTPF